jgi:hypothetical protein
VWAARLRVIIAGARLALVLGQRPRTNGNQHRGHKRSGVAGQGLAQHLSDRRVVQAILVDLIPQLLSGALPDQIQGINWPIGQAAQDALAVEADRPGAGAGGVDPASVEQAQLQLGTPGGRPGDGSELLLQVAPALALTVGGLALGGGLVAAGAGHDRLQSSQVNVTENIITELPLHYQRRSKRFRHGKIVTIVSSRCERYDTSMIALGFVTLFRDDCFVTKRALR